MEIVTRSGRIKGPLTDLFEPLLRKLYSHIASSFLVGSELFHAKIMLINNRDLR